MARPGRSRLADAVRAKLAAQLAEKVAGKVRSAKGKAGAAVAKVPPPSPNPMTNLILTDLLLRGGGRFLRQQVEHALLQTRYDKKQAKNIVAGRGMMQTLISTAVARIATRSVPGAILVGGSMAAKMLYDRARDRQDAREAGAKAISEQAEAGKKATGRSRG